jgi:hypothetical protein
MAQFHFPMPGNLNAILTLLNDGSRGALRLTLVSADGVVQGYHAAEYGTRQVPPPGAIQILQGRQDDAHVLFVADSAEQAAAFLAGCFLGAFHAAPLEDIQDRVTALREPRD